MLVKSAEPIEIDAIRCRGSVICKKKLVKSFRFVSFIRNEFFRSVNLSNLFVSFRLSETKLSVSFYLILFVSFRLSGTKFFVSFCLNSFVSFRLSETKFFVSFCLNSFVSFRFLDPEIFSFRFVSFFGP